MKKTLNFLLLLTLLILNDSGQLAYAKPSIVKLLNYNVYFNDRTGKKRYPEIINYISSGDYNVITLQECTAVFIKMLLEDKRLKNYNLHQGELIHGYTNVILTSLSIAHKDIITFDSKMGRTAPIVYLENENLAIVNVHLESGLSDTLMRKSQIKQIFGTIKNQTNTIITGDFNFGDGEAEDILFKDFIDPGSELKIVTFDIENNPIANHTKYFLEKSRRLDKFFVKCELCNLTQFSVNKLLHSDHWPISVNLKFD